MTDIPTRSSSRLTTSPALDLSKVGDSREVQGWCNYCHQATDWRLTVTAINATLFECLRCDKVKQTVTYASPAPSTHAQSRPDRPGSSLGTGLGTPSGL